MSEEVVKELFLYNNNESTNKYFDDTIAHLKVQLSKPFPWHDMLRGDLKNVLKVEMIEDVRELREEAVVNYYFYIIIFIIFL